MTTKELESAINDGFWYAGGIATGAWRSEGPATALVLGLLCWILMIGVRWLRLSLDGFFARLAVRRDGGSDG